jgi:glycosyltransferase involved in cell wall biosynthesis
MARSTSPRVSVGLPVYNGERYLAAALDGIVAQEFTDFEVIISDNASTDGTADIAQRYADKDERIIYIRNEKNVGAAPNYNQVVRIASGEYFKWHAHDDICAPGYIARCVEVLDADPGVVLAYPRAAMIDDDGDVVKHYPPIVYATEARPSQRARAMLRFETPCLESFGLTRRAILLETSMIGPYTGSDRTLFLELAFRGRFHEVDEVLFYHRQHANRSVHKFKDPRERNAWFDTARADKRRTSPRWRLFGEHVRAVAVAPVSVGERAAAVPGLVGWAGTNGRALAGELATTIGLPSIGHDERPAVG